MTSKWRAEDIPAYLLDGSGRRPTSDLDAQMATPRIIATCLTEQAAKDTLVTHMIPARTYAAQSGREGIYDQAIAALDNGARIVRVQNRVFRLRDMETCTLAGNGNPHTMYQGCPTCTPEDYPAFGRI